MDHYTFLRGVPAAALFFLTAASAPAAPVVEGAVFGTPLNVAVTNTGVSSLAINNGLLYCEVGVTLLANATAPASLAAGHAIDENGHILIVFEDFGGTLLLLH